MKYSLSRIDYINTGKEHDLEFIGATTPTNVHVQTKWRCIHCGKIHNKAYRAVKWGAPNGCSCQNNVTLKAADYEAVAARLGIKWVGKSTPPNTKTETEWETPNGIVKAAYMQLGYRHIAADLLQRMGLSEAEFA